MNAPTFYCLGAAAIDSAFYADSPMSKLVLSQCLTKSRPTIWRYENIAYYAIPDFKEDYPSIPKDLWLIKKSKHDRTVPLSPYQCWVISLIKTCQSVLKKKALVKEFIKNNQYLFTRNNYQVSLSKLANTVTAL